MNYEVLQPVKAKTAAGNTEAIPIGAILDIDPAKAARLVGEGKLKPLISDAEESMTAILNSTRDEIQAGGKWNFTQDVQKAEDHITEVWRAVLEGKAKLSDFTAACETWRTIGTKEGALSL